MSPKIPKPGTLAFYDFVLKNCAGLLLLHRMQQFCDQQTGKRPRPMDDAAERRPVVRTCLAYYKMRAAKTRSTAIARHCRAQARVGHQLLRALDKVAPQLRLVRSYESAPGAA
ncbi:MAG: hypothetical protein ACREVC_14355 [Burkholderiales bacterium]